jgi:hypothetical protein
MSTGIGFGIATRTAPPTGSTMSWPHLADRPAELNSMRLIMHRLSLSSFHCAQNQFQTHLPLARLPSF